MYSFSYKPKIAPISFHNAQKTDSTSNVDFSHSKHCLFLSPDNFYYIMYLIPVLTSITKCDVMNLFLKFLCQIPLLNSPHPVNSNCRWFIHSESVIQSHIILHRNYANPRTAAHNQTDKGFIQFFFRCRTDNLLPVYVLPE